MRTIVAILAIALSMSSCGGGSGSDGTVIEGTLTQTGAGHRSASIVFKHAVGARIEDVKICVLGQCSITDGEGQWGVNIENFPGGDFVISVDGHGISTTVQSSAPASTKNMVVALGRDGNVVTVEKLFIDGEDHSEHDHSR